MAGAQENDWGDQGELCTLVFNEKFHRRTYREGRWTDRKVLGNFYPFWYVHYT